MNISASKAARAAMGSNIRAARLALGLTLHELAARVSAIEASTKHLTWQAAQQWENGGTAPRHERLSAVAEALAISLPRLLGEDAAVDAKAIRNAAIREAMAAIDQTESRKQALQIMEGLIKS